MIFQCNVSHTCGPHSWTGTIDLLKQTPASCEAVVRARGTSFHLIAGSYENGNYLCVPGHSIGCDLSRFTDTLWNREQVSRYLNPVDTESLVCAISCLPQPQTDT